LEAHFSNILENNMAKREIEEINAGSMADIAFLLLIFFLITTTMNLPQVQEERLPQKSEVEFLLNERNVLQIMANKNDKIGIEGEFAEMSDIKEAVKEFYVHPEGTPNQPNYDTLVTIERCKNRLSNLQIALAAYPDAAVYKIDEGIWTRRLNACNALIQSGNKGEFYVLPANATVSIQMDNSTKYITYMKVLDQIMQGLNELRNEYSIEKFGIPFSKLNDKVESDKEKIIAIRQVYPKKIMKEKNRSVQ
jgi:biopolymer transport protein ExbD